MFTGRYEHSIDEKGRMTIPARYRDAFADGAFITQGFDRNLMVWTTTYFDTISKRVNHMSITDPDARDLKRHLFSNGDLLDSDKASRILIPQFLREFAGLQGAVLVVGVGDYLEIWDPQTWQEHNQRMAENEAGNLRYKAYDLSTD